MRWADDLRVELDAIHGEYQRLRAEYLARIKTNDEERVLEAHVRAWLIDRVLARFHWSVGTLLPEFPLERTSEARERRWFLDYLGHVCLDEDGVVPLLVVETKRPSAELPNAATISGIPTFYSPRDILLHDLRVVNVLRGDWRDWLDKACGYVARIHKDHGHYPARFAFTNGDWFVVVVNPKRVFLDKTGTTDDILVFENWGFFRDRVQDAHPHLDLYALLNLEPPSIVSIREFRHLVGAEGGIARVMRGVRVHYAQETDWEIGTLPDIKMLPVLLLKTKLGRWVQYCRPPTDGGIRLPHAARALPDHMARMREVSDGLLTELRAEVELPDPIAISEHLRDDVDAATVPPVRLLPPKAGVSRFLVATGDCWHYLQPVDNRSASCGFHTHSSCPVDQRVADPDIRSVGTKSFFKSGEGHACSHLDARETKGPNPVRLRSDPACFLWSFETTLCCRVCVFESICFSKLDLRTSMPCQDQLSGPNLETD